MRPALSVVALLGLLVACDDDAPAGTVMPVTVIWMDWPAEVNAGTEFRTRIVVWGVCATEPRFHAGASADNHAVTFNPYFVVDPDPIYCLEGVAQPLVAYGVDTAGIAPGLAALNPRTYEMRGSGPDHPPANAIPITPRTFGEVLVRPSGADPVRRNAAGSVSSVADTLGCIRVRPFGTQDALLLEDQADTAGLGFAFVRGYIYHAAAPVCGETRVFHLLSRQ